MRDASPPSSTLLDHTLFRMPSNAIGDNLSKKMAKETKGEMKLFDASSSDLDSVDTSAEAFTSARFTSPQHSIAMSSTADSSPDSTASNTRFATPFGSSSISSTTSESDASPSTNQSRKHQLEEEEEELKRLKRRQSCSPEEKDALDNSFRWTWDSAAAKPPRPSTPALGPKNEEPCYDDLVSTTYQGMPREQCQQIDALGLEEEEADIFQRIWREQKGRELNGLRGITTPEEYFKSKLQEYKDMKSDWAKGQRKHAIREMRESMRFTVLGFPLPTFLQAILEEEAIERLRAEKRRVQVALEEQVTERLLAEKQQKFTKVTSKVVTMAWPKWEGASDGESAWPQ